MAYAARHPDRVSKLVLCSAYARGRGARAVSEEERRAAALDLDLARVGWGRDDPAFRQVFAAQFIPDGTRADWAAFDQLQRRTTSPENAVRFLEEFGRIDVRDEAGQVSCPTLIMHSRDDHRQPLRFGEELAALIPDSRLVALDSNNHLLTATEPAWQVFRDEVERVSGGVSRVLPRPGHQISTESPHILHVRPLHSHSCWSHEKAHPHPAPGCHRAARPWHPVRLLERHVDRRDEQPRKRRPATAPATPAPFPQSAKYIADMKVGRRQADGHRHRRRRRPRSPRMPATAPTTKRGSSATRRTGKIDITSRFKDTLKAEFDGKDVVGDLTMNGVAYKFTAPPVPAPAGMYTAAFEGVRASWVVRPDGSAIGVQFNGGVSGRDFEQAELQQLNELQFRNSVRNKRQLQQAQQIAFLANKSASSTINGHQVTPVVVDGDFRL